MCLVKAHVSPPDALSPRLRPLPGLLQPSLYGGQLGHLLREAQEEHAKLPVPPPPSPVLLGAAQQHRATGTVSGPPVPLEEDRSWRLRRHEVRKQACREEG
jgi:hypothetical protein